MARMARIVIPEVPHHITQRGNRRQTVFFRETDYELYYTLLQEWSGRAGMKIMAYCLMPNHVHLVVIPQERQSLHVAMREIHRRYSSTINLREGWRGYLWQGRFSSFPMDEAYTHSAIRYVEQNPVRACLVEKPEEWIWSSASSRLGSESTYSLSSRFSSDEYLHTSLRRHESTGRPLGSEDFIRKLEGIAGRALFPQKRGPKPNINTIK